ncbi:MAG: DUF4097 family beta strand repeat protein [Gemmatimonadaceae bacterium]|nr:DUF4097 family beta strand repeat protein [Gemmatimonadaceae bacterium]
MPRLRRWVWSLAVWSAGVAGALTAQGAPVQRGWRALPSAAIKVHAPTGTLEVEGWDRDSVSLSGVLATGETLFGGGSAAGLKLGAEGRASGGRTRLLVRVPFAARLVVRSGAADVEVRGVSGTIDVGAAAGEVDVSGDAEAVTAESISGAVHVSGRIAHVRARTTRGSLEIAGRIGEAQLESFSGPVSVSGQPLGRVRVETVEGRVTIDGRLAPDGALDVETFGGAVRIELPADQAAALDLRGGADGIGGRIGRPALDLAALAVRTASTAALQRRIGAPGRVMPPVTVRSFRGRIVVESLPR